MTEKRRKMDRRIAKTKKAVKEAYLQLLREKSDYRQISVKELVDRADVNRSTFYLHYYDIDAVFEQLIDEMFAEIGKKISEAQLNVEEIEKVIRQMTIQIEENRDYSLIVSRGNELPYFSKKMAEMIKNKISVASIRNPHLNEEEKRFLLDILSKMTCDITSYLIKNYEENKISAYFELIREYVFDPAIRKILSDH